MVQQSRNICMNSIYILSWHFKHAQNKVHEVKSNETILKTGMIHGFDEMCDVHEETKDLVCVFYSCSSHVYSTI